ncbi:MAG TPA: hypothetical protein VGO16_03315 [Pseudonocardiaceae bacterium]|jgi:hypothetical protein|nr:hypothetical protein [Pseudonocardiaceae bacterium]
MVKAVVTAPEPPEPVRAVAEQTLREMDSIGRAMGSYQRVKDAERVSASTSAASVLAPLAASVPSSLAAQ